MLMQVELSTLSSAGVPLAYANIQGTLLSQSALEHKIPIFEPAVIKYSRLLLCSRKLVTVHIAFGLSCCLKMDPSWQENLVFDLLMSQVCPTQTTTSNMEDIWIHKHVAGWCI
ncbi:uncharacterized protein LOC142566288 [Dermacentor variabilis]|uniref:uncharacterized protein LOC142566288 n=1 Tax=Dermacentor variabilis TaxID=34621 RepID=UPI003F5B434E